MVPFENLARAFADELRAWLTPDEWAEMRKRNAAETTSYVCHSHDFCDANMVMDAAFTKVTGRDFLPDDLSDDEPADWDVTTWNAAWTIAKRRYLTEGSDG